MLAGLGSLCALPIVISMTADLSSAARRGRTLLFPSVGNLGGAALAFAAGGWLLGATAHLFQPLAGWRRVHLVFGAASLLVVLALALLREPIRQETDELATRSFRTELEGIWSRRGFLMPLFLGQVTVVMADTAASIWAAPVLSRDFHQEPAQFAGWLGLIILLAGLVGSIIGGVASEAACRAPLSRSRASSQGS
jgi:MFS family permease